MADAIWVGKQKRTPQVDTVTVTAAAVGGRLDCTINGKVFNLTTATTNTTTEALAFQTMLAAVEEPEFEELTFNAPAANVFTVTGPDDGAPFTMAVAGAGGSTVTRSTTTTSRSPHDISSAVNYLGGAAPAAGDRIVFDRGEVDCLYYLDTYAGTDVDVYRAATYAGRIGLPGVNPAGYAEYRPTHLETEGADVRVEQADDDDAGQVRVRCTLAGAVTVTVTGPGAGQAVGGEAVEVYGLGAGSTVSVSGAAVAVAPLVGQAATVATLRATDATVWVGPGVTLTAAHLRGTAARLECGYTTLTQDRGGEAEVVGSGSGTTTTTDGGTVLWRSSGGPGAVNVGSGGVFDAGRAPAAFTVGTVTVTEGAAVLDPAGRMTRPWVLKLDRAEVQNVTLDLGAHLELTADDY